MKEPEHGRIIGYTFDSVQGFEILPNIWCYRFYINQDGTAPHFFRPFRNKDAI